MTMLRDLLTPFQSDFSDTQLGRERSHWFIFTLLAVIVPFTSSVSSNLLRSLQNLFGLDLNARRFYRGPFRKRIAKYAKLVAVAVVA